MSNNLSFRMIGLPSSPSGWMRWGLGLAIFGFVYYAFWVQLVERGLSCYQWLVGHWSGVSNYSHGPLIPFIASFLVWWNVSRRPENADQNWREYWIALGAGGATLLVPEFFGSMLPSLKPLVAQIGKFIYPFTIVWQFLSLRKAMPQEVLSVGWGHSIVAVAMITYYLGVKSGQPRITVFAFILLLYGLVLVLAGRSRMKILFFPISFLLLMIPLNFLEERVGLPLRMLMATASTVVLNLIGVGTVQVGTGIHSTNGVFQLDVAAPCSGIRSLMALTTITAAYGYITQHQQWKRWVLFLSAMPLAVLGNMARVTSIAVVAQVYGQGIAAKEYHDASGFIVFSVALSTMVLIGLLLKFEYRKLWKKWLQPPDDRTGAGPTERSSPSTRRDKSSEDEGSKAYEALPSMLPRESHE